MSSKFRSRALKLAGQIQSALARALLGASRRLGGPSRVLAVVASALLLALGAFYLAAPYRAVRALRVGLRERSGSALAAAIDMPRVSASLQAQVAQLLAAAEARAPRPGSGDVVIGRVGPSVARTLARPLIERVFTADGIADFLAHNGGPARDLVRIANGPPRRSPEGVELAARASAVAMSTWLDRVESMRFHTATRFAVRLEGGWVVWLGAYGLRWKVYDVEVPADLFEI